MASLARANKVAQMVTKLSGKKTYIVRSTRAHQKNVDVWHGGKCKEFGTNQAATAWLDKLYDRYSC